MVMSPIRQRFMSRHNVIFSSTPIRGVGSRSVLYSSLLLSPIFDEEKGPSKEKIPQPPGSPVSRIHGTGHGKIAVPISRFKPKKIVALPPRTEPGKGHVEEERSSDRNTSRNQSARLQKKKAGDGVEQSLLPSILQKDTLDTAHEPTGNVEASGRKQTLQKSPKALHKKNDSELATQSWQKDNSNTPRESPHTKKATQKGVKSMRNEELEERRSPRGKKKATVVRDSPQIKPTSPVIHEEQEVQTGSPGRKGTSHRSKHQVPRESSRRLQKSHATNHEEQDVQRDSPERKEISHGKSIVVQDGLQSKQTSPVRCSEQAVQRASSKRKDTFQIDKIKDGSRKRRGREASQISLLSKDEEEQLRSREGPSKENLKRREDLLDPVVNEQSSQNVRLGKRGAKFQDKGDIIDKSKTASEIEKMLPPKERKNPESQPDRRKRLHISGKVSKLNPEKILQANKENPKTKQKAVVTETCAETPAIQKSTRSKKANLLLIETENLLPLETSTGKSVSKNSSLRSSKQKSSRSTSKSDKKKRGKVTEMKNKNFILDEYNPFHDGERVIVPLGDNNDLRRSKRTRVKPLDYWKGERCLYKPTVSGYEFYEIFTPNLI